MAAAIGCGRFYHKLYKSKCRELEDDGIDHSLIDTIAEEWTVRQFNLHKTWADKLLLKDKDVFEKGWFFLTIRPHDDLPFDKFKEFVCDLFKKRWLHAWEYVWEQKGTSYDTMGKGAHIHSILKVTSPSKGKAYFLNEIVRLVTKKGYDECIAKNCIDMNAITSENDMTRRRTYINTSEFSKADATKEDAWAFDEPWRNSKGLPSLIKSVRDVNNGSILDYLASLNAK